MGIGLLYYNKGLQQFGGRYMTQWKRLKGKRTGCRGEFIVANGARGLRTQHITLVIESGLDAVMTA